MKGEPQAKGQAPGWCVHYRPSTQHETCGAGVRFTELWKDQPFHVRPCFLTPTGHSKPGALECPHLRRPTAQEIADYRAWMQSCMEVYAKVLEMIAEATWDGDHQTKQFFCPACGKGLRVTRTVSRRKDKVLLSGACETLGCFAFMT